MLSVVIPAYDEAERIAPTLRAVSAWCGAAPRFPSYEILVVDDGSTDRTADVVRMLAGELPSLRLIESSPNRGKGYAVRVGMLQARGTIRAFMDADHSIPVTQLPLLLERIQAGADVAIASRHAPGAVSEGQTPWYRRAWSRLANRVVRAGLVDGIHDTQCGMKAFTASAADVIFRQARCSGWAFDVEVLALARALGLTIAECGVVVRDDPRSRVRPLRDALSVTWDFARIRGAFRRHEYDLSSGV